MNMHDSLGSKLYQLITFVLFAVFLSSVPEWQNHILINFEVSGYYGFIRTLILYGIISLLSFLFFRYLASKFSWQRALFIMFVTGAVFGLVVFEWIFIGHTPVNENVIQYTMFVYWGVILASPVLLIKSAKSLTRSKIIKLFSLAYLFLVPTSMFLGQFDSLEWVLFYFIIASWTVLFTFGARIVFEEMGIIISIKRTLLLALVLPIVELLLPFPYSFIFVSLVVLLLMFFSHRKIITGDLYNVTR